MNLIAKLPFRGVLAFLSLLLMTAPATAQLSRNKVKIVQARVGLPPGPPVNSGGADSQIMTGYKSTPLTKYGMWAPVTFQLEVTGESESLMQVEIESYDGDNYKTTVRWQLGQILLNPASTGPDDKFRPRGSMVEPTEMPYTAYVRIGTRPEDITLRILTADPGKATSSVSEPYRVGVTQVRELSTYAIVSLGSNLRGFMPPQVNSGLNNTENSRSHIELSRIDSVPAMPDQWFGYEAADLVVLTTSNPSADFLQNLFDKDKSQPHAARREALLEWVRRGGRLLISVGKTGNILRQMEAFTDILPARITATENVRELKLDWTEQGYNRGDRRVPANRSTKGVIQEGDPFPILKLAAGSNSITLMPPVRQGGQQNPQATPLVVQRAYGLGKITLTAFDIDSEVVSQMTPNNVRGFWEWLVRTAGSDKAYSKPRTEKESNYNMQNDDGVTTGIRAYIDTFDGVPVISFGWVALFIILYMIVIGPLEYIVLKKVLGRLELTWITFPIIVISVSVAAYFTAYSVKGKDTKTNKIDVVDYVLEPDGSGRVYGRTWFTIFSPRTDNYTLAIQPRQPWTGPNTERPPAALVDWLGGGKTGESSFASSYRKYSYTIDPTGNNGAANSINGVPAQVWSTKAFTAQWSGTFDAASAPLVSAIRHPPSNPNSAEGTVTINLPFTNIAEAAFIYRDRFIPIPAIPQGTPLTFVSQIGMDQSFRATLLENTSWFYNSEIAASTGYSKTYSRPQNVVGTLPLWSVLFHESAIKDDRGVQNGSCRGLDQSWRLNERNVDEVILIVRLWPVSAPGESLMTEPDSSSPTTLWMHGTPADNKPREAWPGSIKQETYVRFYIPIKPSGRR